MMVWQLMQVRRLYDMPLILVGLMWGEWARRYLLRPESPLAGPADLDIPHCVPTAQEAIALLQHRHRDWLAAQARQV